jgi:outer membrane receptor protein involved in Fe transport
MIRAVPLAALLLPALAATTSAQHRAPAQTIDTLRVVSRASSAASATRSVETISHDEIARRAGRSLADILGASLGLDVQTRSPAQSDLSIRGSTFNQVVVLVDGIRVSDVQSGHYALDLAVPTAMIERIEILRGTGSALYGSDAVGGIVNIVTRSDDEGATLAARGGSFGGAMLSGSRFGAVGGTRVRVAADADRSDGHRPGTDFRVAQLRVAAERETRAGRVIADLGQGVRRFGAADFYSPFFSDETTRSSTAALRLVAPAADRVALNGSLHLRRHGDLFTLKRDDPAFYQNVHTSTESGGELSGRAVIAPGIVAAVGADLLDARLRSARLGDHRQTRTGAFGQVTLGDLGRPTLDLGVRRDGLSDASAFVSPSVAVAIPLGTATRVRASVARGFRAPTWTERFYVDPANVSDSTLAVERFWSREVGLHTVPVSWLGADVALFERRATDLIDWARNATDPASAPWRTRNFASAVYRGLEASVTLPQLLGADWTVRGAGLRFDPVVDVGTIGKYALRPITRSLGVSALAPVWGTGTVTLDAMRARRAGERDHTMVNARLVVPVRGLRASLELVNLGATSYLDGAGKPVAGRSVYAGLSWDSR